MEISLEETSFIFSNLEDPRTDSEHKRHLLIDIIAIDGKTVRGSQDMSFGKRAIHMVSAWSTSNRVVLSQEKVSDKSNEITAIPEVLRSLTIKGSVVTLDAMGCQKSIAAQIIEQKGDKSKGTMRTKRLRAALSEKYLENLIFNSNPMKTA